MFVKILASQVYPKFAKINFHHTKDEKFPNYVREAVAFPNYFADNEKVSIPYPDFCRVLSPGNTVHIVWSKNLNSFVVRFSDKDFSDISSEDADMPF
jgi:hypothetical protein|nr:MAG TPA: hypothetical protein [Inoviridae sp.]